MLGTAENLKDKTIIKSSAVATSPQGPRRSSRLNHSFSLEATNATRKSGEDVEAKVNSLDSSEAPPLMESNKRRRLKNPRAEIATCDESVYAVAPSLDPFTLAKRAFHRSGSFKIVGRIEEKAELTSFWYETIAQGKGASMYISGNPGTGKTALVDELIPELIASDESSDILQIKVNCMMLKDPLKTFAELAKAMNWTDLIEEQNPYLVLAGLEQRLMQEKEQRIVFIIDEIDQIGMKDAELMCRFLAIPYQVGMKSVIIGIANSIDLTERFLPRLKVLKCDPVVLHFPQYSVADISAILCDRLEQINSSLERPFIDRPAIELTARKVASTGDLRRALDLIRQAIDLAEDEYKLLVPGSESASSNSLVKLTHVARIVEKFGNAQSGPLMLLKSLNLHQKVILAAVLGFIKTIQLNSANGNRPQSNAGRRTSLPPPISDILTLQRLYDQYCSGALIPPKLYEPVTRSEFIDLISNLESMSVIGTNKSNSTTTATTSSNSGSTHSRMDLWQEKVYLIVPGELVKTMLEEFPTIRALFGV